MSLDKQKILNELGNVVNQLQSADCGCMSRLFNEGHNQNNGAGYGCHGGHFGWGHNSCAGEPHMASCVARCNPPKLIADTYNYYDQHVVKPAMEEVYNELKSITPHDTVMEHPLASQMGDAQRGMPKMIDPSNHGSIPYSSQQMGSMQGQRQENPQGNAIGGMPGQHMNGLQAQPMNGMMAGQGQALGGMVTGQNQAMGHPGYQGQPLNGTMAGHSMAGQGQVNSDMIAGQGNVTPGHIPAQFTTNRQVMGNMMADSNQPAHIQDQAMRNMMQGHEQVLPISNQGQAMGSVINSQGQLMSVMPAQVTSPNMGGVMPGQGQATGGMPNMMQPSNYHHQVPVTSRSMNGQRPHGDHTAALKKFNEVFPGVMSGELGFNPMEMAIQMNTETMKQQAINATKSAMISNNKTLPGQAPTPTMNQQQMNQPPINQQLMNQHPINQQPMNQQLMNQHLMNQQLMNQQQMNPQQMNPQQINPQLMNAQQLNPQQMNPQQMNPQQMNQQQINPQQMNSQQINPQQINSQEINPQQINQLQIPHIKNQQMPSLFNQQQVSPTMNQQQVFQSMNPQQIPSSFNQQQTMPPVHEEQLSSVTGQQQIDTLTNEMPQAVYQLPLEQQRLNQHQVNQLQMPRTDNQQLQPMSQQMSSNNKIPSSIGATYASSQQPTDMSAQQFFQATQKMDPILPAETETGFNTLGQPVEMVPGNIYRRYDNGSPQPIIGGGYGYSNVKSTVSKTSLVGNRGTYKTPSRSQLQHLYNQYKGSQSFTQQNIRDPKYAGTASDGQLNVAVRGNTQNQNIPIERVGGDTAPNIPVNQPMKGEHQGGNLQPNKVEQVMGQIGDVPTKLPKQENIPANIPQPPSAVLPKKCRNGLQDMTYTSYSLGASWTFHGSPPPRVFRPNNLLSIK